MNFNTTVQQEVLPSTGHTAKVSKGFGTGKGTTAKITEFFSDLGLGYTVEEVASAIDVPSRQLSKRMSELVKRGILSKDGKKFASVANNI